MKKILHISKYYYPFRGGTEQVARDCVNALKDNYNQKVICFNDSKKDSTDHVDEIEILRAGCFAKISSQSISFSYPRILKRVIDSYSPDMIIFHYPNPYVAHFLLRVIPNNCKLILYWHLDITKQKFIKLFFEGQNQRLLDRADIVIATSEAYIKGSKYLLPIQRKVVAISNCINEDRLKVNAKSLELSKKIREQNQGKTICFSCGRHTKYKGIDYLIKAAHILDDSFQFYIAGKGEETRNLLREAGNDSKIHFLGVLNDEELKAYYCAMDIFCFPSITRNEAFGLALAEAMYYRKPAITFCIPGSGVNTVCVNNETGIEVANGDVRAYALAITTLSKDEELRRKMSCKAEKRVKEEYSFIKFKTRMISMINNL